MARVAVAVLCLVAVVVAAVVLLRSGADPVAPQPMPARESAIATPEPRPAAAARDAPLRVLLTTADMATPAPGRTIHVHAYTPRRMERPRYVASFRTDEAGVASCVGLEPGSYIVCAPGAATGSPEPRTARATLVAGAAPVAVRLVEPPPALRVRIDVQADFTPRYGVSSKLLFRRKDDGSGERFEQPDVLKPGARVLEMELPEGRYAVEVEPEGELVVRPEDRVLVVRDPMGDARVVLGENPARVDVTLRGVPADELPVRVYAQPADGAVLDDRPERSWWGPHRWRSATTQVPSLDGPRRLVVFGRSAVFRATRPVPFDSDSATVELEPAARVVVEWYGWDPARDAGAIVTAEHGDELVARSLAPRFGAGHPELERPAFGGELILGKGGTVRLECSRSDGSTAWERTVALDEPLVRVRVGSP